MRVVSMDIETAIGLKSQLAPPLACLSWAERRGSVIERGLVSRYQALPLFRSWLEDDNVLLVGHNVGFDTVGCMHANEAPASEYGLGPSQLVVTPDIRLRQLLFRKYRLGLVLDTMLRERLIELSRGTLNRPKGYYSLGEVAERRLGRVLDKEEDSWRLRYGQLIPYALHDWPHRAKQYALDDAVSTLEVFEQQGTVPDDAAQARAGFVLYLMRAWGMRTDPVAVAALEHRLMETYHKLGAELQEWELLREDGSQDMGLTRALIEVSYPGGQPPRTKPSDRWPRGQVKTANEIVEQCTHPALKNLATYKDTQKVIGTFLPVVKRGINEPICPYINPIVKNGRTSYRDPNLQQLPRDGGVRECFIPRPGKLFVDVDYDSLEVRTLAEVLYNLVDGKKLVEKYQHDPDYDPHSDFGGKLLDLSYEEAMRWKSVNHNNFRKDTRQMCKAAVFGLPGGMGARTFVEYAKATYNVILTVQKSEWLKQEYMKFVPDIVPYFAMVSRMTQGDRRAVISQLYSGRVRGGMSYCDTANGYWSGLAADGAKYALFNISEACYARPETALFGARPVVFVHDQFMLEADEERGHEVGMELADMAMASMQVFTPHVPSRAAPQLMRRWRKDAEPVYKQGRLVPYGDNV